MMQKLFNIHTPLFMCVACSTTTFIPKDGKPTAAVEGIWLCLLFTIFCCCCHPVLLSCSPPGL